MEALLGKVSGINGKFFAEDGNGDIVELKNGDGITLGMTVFGDSSNSASAMITVAMEDSGEVVNISGSSRQLFDNSLVNEVGGADDILSALEDSETTDKQDEEVDDETAAGEENVEGSGDSSGVFAARDGSSTNISAGLRDAQFFTDENRAEEDGILLDNGIALEEVTEPNEEPNTVPTAPVLSMNIEPIGTAHAYNGDNYMTGHGGGTLGSLKLDGSGNLDPKHQNARLIEDDLGFGAEENVKGNKPVAAGSEDLGIEDNETIVFDLKDTVNSVTFDLNSKGGLAFDGSWKAFDANGTEIGNTSNTFNYTGTGQLVIEGIGDFRYIAIDGMDHTQNASGPGFYADAVNMTVVNPESTGYEYAISLDADLAGSNDIPGDLTDITLSDLPDDATLYDSSGTEIIANPDGSYNVAIDDDGKADLTLVSPDSLDSAEIDAIDSSVFTTDGYMSVTDSQSDDTTLSVSSGSIDFSSLVDDHDSLENIDLDVNTNQVASISLDDVLDMTDSNNELSITGNDGDILTVDSNGWSETEPLADNTYTFVNDLSGDSITLIVDDQIDVIGA